MTVDAITQLQQDLCDLLNSESYFAPISILQEKEGVRDNDVLESLGVRRLKAGKSGAAVVVPMPSATIIAADVFAVRYQLDFAFSVWTIPKLNLGGAGSGKTAEDIAQTLEQLLHNRKIGTTIFLAQQRDPLVGTAKDFEDSIIGYRCNFSAVVQLPSNPKCAQPRSPFQSAPAGNVTLTGNLPSAQFYYTIDGSLPTNLKTLYTVPFAPPAPGTLIRAVAYLASTITSDVTEFVAI